MSGSARLASLVLYTKGNNLRFIGGNEDVVSELVCDGFRMLPIHNYGSLPLTRKRQTGDGIAISVASAQKKYGGHKVLQGLNMRVDEGIIYGLLGSSGCGKTTLLSCIVGLRKLDSGRIRICGKRPGEAGRFIGFMPQDIALNGEFTIREVAHFFGSLYGMNKGKVDDRLYKLLKLLDLTKSRKRIKNLSGGEKRRASFLIALLHDPPILILDEPTVGIDPLIALRIWKHLRDLVDINGTTVIITTHCIEEMRHADTVGIMRNGLLMVEDSPQALMKAHNATMLEEVVLKYCLRTTGPEAFPDVATSTSANGRPRSVRIQTKSSVSRPNRAQQNRSQGSGGFSSNLVSVQGHQADSFHRTCALVSKNVTVMIRSIWLLLFLLLTPCTIVVIYCYCMGADPTGLGLGIVNEEGVDCRGSIRENVREMGLACTPQNLSCAFVKQLEATKAFKIRFYATEKLALSKVDEKEAWGYVHFGQNFSRHFSDRMLKIKNSINTIDGAKIEVRLDMSSVQVGAMIQKLIYEAYETFSRKFVWACGLDPTLLDLPISIQQPLYGSKDGRMSSYLAPGMTIAFIMSLTAITAGLVLILEEKDGMVERTKVAGVTTFEVLLSHFIPQVGIILVQNFIAFLIMFVWFDIPHVGSIPLAFSVAILFEMSGTVLGLMSSTIFDDEKNAMLLSIFSSISVLVLAGFTFPVDSLAYYLRKLSTVLPGTHAGESIRSILLRGWDIQKYSVYIGFVTPLLFMSLYAGVTFVMIKRRK